MHPATLPIDDLLADCETTRTRRSGPGGQHRNKVETAVVLQHQPTGVSAEASERRSQGQNRAVAIFRLRVNLALEVRSEPASQPVSPLWQSRCKGGRISISPQHDDFPAILAEALDAVHSHQFDVKAAATHLQCSTSQLAKLLKLEPRAWAAVNNSRRAAGLHALK